MTAIVDFLHQATDGTLRPRWLWATILLAGSFYAGWHGGYAFPWIFVGAVAGGWLARDAVREWARKS